MVLSGFVKNERSGELLPGATVYSSETSLGTVTNAYGFYSLSLPAGNHTITCSYLGFKQFSTVIQLNNSLRLNHELIPQTVSLSEVEIKGISIRDQRRSPILGIEKINPESIRKMPVLFGESDPLKSIQLLPGISSTSEGSTTLSVRGGNPDQNLLQFDEAIVYNGGHLLGFFSIFNNDAIKEVQVYKGDLPAWTGGRISSLIDIRSRDGNMNNFSGIAGVGLISSKVTLEGPVNKGKSSFLVSGRRTYLDLFLPLSPDKDIRDNKLYFFDTNLKYNLILSENDRVFVSGYFGKDVLKNQFAGLNFGNGTLTLRWNHLYSQKLFSNATMVFSKYNYYLETFGDGFDPINWKSKLNDFSLKYAFSYYPKASNMIEFGIHTIHHTIHPGQISATQESSMADGLKIPVSNSLEHALYVSNTRHLNASITIRYGLRFSLFQNIGTGTSFKLNENFEPTDTLRYSRGDIFNTYAGLEPRLGISWLISPIFTLKGSYTNTRQYLHLASNSTSTTPLDVWYSSSPNIKPQISNQVSLGFNYHEPAGNWEHSIELFHKKNRNAIDFKDHPDLLLNEALEGEIRTGTATSQGIELLSKYNKGPISGWIAYTLSQSVRQSKWINNGKRYPSPYNHPHDISLVVNYLLNKRIHFSANWVYATGSPITLPVGRYDFQGGVLPVYSERNAERLPDYHRMDVAVTIQGKNPESRQWKNEWNISVYNLYGRKNAWMIGFTSDDDINPYVKQAEITYLFSIVPSVSYIIKF